jgi:drug/metabolite transporter (DMT)-like permease
VAASETTTGTTAERVARANTPDEHLPQEALLGAMLVLASGVGFGAVAVLFGVAIAGGANAPTALVVRFGLGGLLLTALAVARGQARRLPARRLAGLALMGLLFSGGSVASFKSIEHMPAALSSLLFYTYPVLVTLGSMLLFRARYSLARLAVLPVSLAGCALTVELGSGAVDATGVALALLSPVFYSGYVLIGSRVSRNVPTLLASAWIIGVSAVIMLLVGLTGLLGEHFTTDISARGWAAMLGLALFSTVLAISTFLAGIARIDVFRAAILSTGEPVISVALAALLLGERLSLRQGLGGVLIVGAGVALQLIARREGRRPRHP